MLKIHTFCFGPNFNYKLPVSAPTHILTLIPSYLQTSNPWLSSFQTASRKTVVRPPCASLTLLQHISPTLIIMIIYWSELWGNNQLSLSAQFSVPSKTSSQFRDLLWSHKCMASAATPRTTADPCPHHQSITQTEIHLQSWLILGPIGVMTENLQQWLCHAIRTKNNQEHHLTHMSGTARYPIT